MDGCTNALETNLSGVCFITKHFVVYQKCSGICNFLPNKLNLDDKLLDMN